LLRHLHSTRDADFSSARLVAAHDDELADQLGNLVRRTLTLIARHRDGIVPAPAPAPWDGEEAALAAQAEATRVEAAAGFAGFALHQAAAAVWRLVAAANRYADRSAPWTLARAAAGGDREADGRLDTVLYALWEPLRVIAVEATPIIPGAAARIAEQLG